MINIIVFITALIAAYLTVASETRLYTAVGDWFVYPALVPDDYIPDIEINTDTDSLLMGEIDPYFYRDCKIKAKCSLKHLSDSFFVINSNPLETAFDNISVKVFDDSTLNGRVRITVLTQDELSDQSEGCPLRLSTQNIGFIYIWEYKPGEKDIDISNFTIYLEPRSLIMERNFLLDRYMGMKKDDYRLVIKDNPAFFSPDKSVVIELPNFSSEIYDLYYIRDNIIILTDDKLVWNGITYRRSRFNSLMEKQRNSKDFKVWPSRWRETEPGVVT